MTKKKKKNRQIKEEEEKNEGIAWAFFAIFVSLWRQQTYFPFDFFSIQKEKWNENKRKFVRY